MTSFAVLHRPTFATLVRATLRAVIAAGSLLGAPAAAQLTDAFARCAGTSDPAAAIDACTSVVQSSTSARNRAVAYSNRGVAHGRQGNHTQAAADFEQAIRLDPSYARAYFNRGNAHGRKGHFDLALADFNQAIRLDHTFAPAYDGRAAVLRSKGELDRAIGEATNALRLDPNLATAYGTRGTAYAQKGELDRGLADLNEAIRLDLRLASAWSSRGLVYARKGDAQRALPDYDEAIRLDPKLAIAFNNRALVHRTLRNLDRALSDLGRAIELKPDYALAYANRGLVRREKGDFGGAIGDLDHALRLKPGDAAVHLQRGLAHEQKGNRDFARADFETALAIDPNKVEARTGRTRVTTVMTAPSNSASAPLPTASMAPAGSAARVVPPPAPATPPAQPHNSKPEQSQASTGVPSTAHSLKAALAGCDSSASPARQVVIETAGGRRIEIPACFRGRRHLECTISALTAEAAAIDRDYGEIVRANYPDIKDAKSICRIEAGRIDAHIARADGFDARASALTKAFGVNAACVESVRDVIGDVDLGAMSASGALMTSLLTAVSEPIEQAAQRHREVLKTVRSIEASQRALSTIRGIRPLVCAEATASLPSPAKEHGPAIQKPTEPR